MAACAGGAELTPDLPYQAERSEEVTYDIDFSVVVTPPSGTKVLKVWLPLPQSDFGQQVLESKLASFPVEVQPQIAAEKLFGNKFAHFEFREPRGAQIIRHQFRIRVWELNWNLDPEQVQEVRDWPAAFQPYRRSESQAVQFDERFHALLEKIVPQRRGPLTDLSRVLLFASDHFIYDHHDASLKADAARMIEKQRGHCSDYHGFCAAMGRALGYPTRITYGLHALPKNSPSHCKLEAFLPPYGWVSFDVSETQKLIQAIRQDGQLSPDEKQRLERLAHQRLTSGFRDNTWLCLTRGSDYDLAPPASRRVPVVRTAWIEADGQPLADPDPSDPAAKEFAWMTVHKVTADRDVPYPFQDHRALLKTVRPTSKSPRG